MKEAIQVRLEREREAKQIKDKAKKETLRWIDMPNAVHDDKTKREIVFERAKLMYYAKLLADINKNKTPNPE